MVDDQPINVRLLQRKLERADMEALVAYNSRDCGEGIDPDVEAHIFEQFISSKATVGRGMGLTAARSTIRNLGGDLELSAREGDGISAVFTHPV